LKDVLESPVDENINPVKGIDKLFAINIDPENSAEEYRNRVTQPLGEFLQKEIKKRRRPFRACTTEILDEFSRFVSGETEGEKFDIISFSTPPQQVTPYDYLIACCLVKFYR
jgi:arsenite-transporting ATPase